MKYSIIISPINENSNASLHALNFVKAIMKIKQHDVSVFFYGHAVINAFKHHSEWCYLSQQNVSLMACSTIAEKYLNHSKPVNYISLAGLGQWMEYVHEADKNIEFA